MMFEAYVLILPSTSCSSKLIAVTMMWTFHVLLHGLPRLPNCAGMSVTPFPHPFPQLSLVLCWECSESAPRVGGHQLQICVLLSLGKIHSKWSCQYCRVGRAMHLRASGDQIWCVVHLEQTSMLQVGRHMLNGTPHAEPCLVYVHLWGLGTCWHFFHARTKMFLQIS